MSVVVWMINKLNDGRDRATFREVSSLWVVIMGGNRRKAAYYFGWTSTTRPSVGAEGKGYAAICEKSSTETIESRAVCYATLE